MADAPMHLAYLGHVGGVPKMAAGAEAFLEDAGCWQASLPNARELLPVGEAAGARERARVGGSGRRVDCSRAWLAPGSPEEGTTLRPAKEGWRWRASLAFVTCGAALGCSLEAVVECGGTQTGSSCRIHFNRFTEYISTGYPSELWRQPFSFQVQQTWFSSLGGALQVLVNLSLIHI